MTTMIRKQIYVTQRQEEILKRLAQSRGVSEAELIREAVDRQIEQGASGLAHYDPEAWEKAHALMLNLYAQGPIPDRPRQWTRQDLYAERMNRHGDDTH